MIQVIGIFSIIIGLLLFFVSEKGSDKHFERYTWPEIKRQIEDDVQKQMIHEAKERKFFKELEELRY